MRRGRAPARRRRNAPRGHRIPPLPEIIRAHRTDARTGARIRTGNRKIPATIRPQTRRNRPRGRRDKPTPPDDETARRSHHRRTRIRHTAYGCNARARTHPLRRDNRRNNPNRYVFAYVLPRRNLGVNRNQTT